MIAARAEVDAAKLMREAADSESPPSVRSIPRRSSLLPAVLSSPAAIQIRQLEALQNMARNSGSKTIFVPMNLMQPGEGVGNTAMIQQLANA